MTADATSNSYRAAVLRGYRRLELEQFSIPEVGTGELLLRVRAANVCSTDVRKWDDAELVKRLGDRPLILGHEIAGEVVAVGSGVEDFQVGDRVAVDPIIREQLYGDSGELLGVGAAAGDPIRGAELLAKWGIGGGFGEILKVPVSSAMLLPDAVPFEAGSLVEPLADVVNSVNAAGDIAHRRCAVFGLGPMGLMHVAVLTHRGAEVLGVDLQDERRAKGLEVGAKATMAPEAVVDIDVAFIAAGRTGLVPAVGQALRALRRGGAAVLFASAPSGTRLSLDVNRLHYEQQRLVGVVGFERGHATEAFELLATGVIDVEAIRRPHVPLESIQLGFEQAGAPDVVKVAVDLP